MARNAVENYSILHGTLFHSYAAVIVLSNYGITNRIVLKWLNV